MSYQDQAQQMGRTPFEFVTIDMDRCNLTFGVGVCDATGEPCYNTWATCKKKSVFDKGVFTYQFTEARSDIPVGFDCVSLIQSIQYAPQQLTPGKGLGVRGAVTIRFADAPWPDHIFDPYFDQRPIYGDALGSFWGRWLARHKYNQGRFLRVHTGYLVNGVYDPAHFKSRSYVIDKITGPDKNGTVTITAKDILKLADDDKAKCPRATNARLDADITAIATTLAVYPAGSGDLEFDTEGYIRISNEMMAFTRSGDTFTVERGEYSTAAKEQNVDSTVQQSAIFYQMQIQDIIYSLLVDYAKIPSTYINKSEWDAERDAHLIGVYSAIITEPVGVNTLLAELTEQGQCYIWWDEVAQKIRFKALVPPVNNLPVYTDDNHFLAGSLTANLDAQSRTSRFIVYFDGVDPTKKLDESSNYRQRHIGADLQSESDVEYGTSKSKIIYSRWFGQGSLGRVQQLSTALLNRYRDPPRLFDFELDAAEGLKTGDYFNVSTRLMQTASGANDVVSMQVIETQESKAGSVVKYKSSELIFVEQSTAPEGDIIINGDVFDLNLRALYESEYGAPPTSGLITFYIMQTAFVSSSSAYRPAYIQKWNVVGDGQPTRQETIPSAPEIPAIDTGVWPEGLDILIRIAGKTIGRGGDGAIGTPYHDGDWNFSERRGGHRGAPAILNRHSKVDIVIEATGVVARGGSGGGAMMLIDHDDIKSNGFVVGGGGAPYGNAGLPLERIEEDVGYVFVDVKVDPLSIADKDTAGQSIHAGDGWLGVGESAADIEGVNTGAGGNWGALGTDGQLREKTVISHGDPFPDEIVITDGVCGIAGEGGAAIVGTAPRSVTIDTGGQYLETV